MIHLLGIDPQCDFCDPRGTLYVPGADNDMNRAAGFIERHLDRLDAIHITLDSHHRLSIFHPMFWVNETGNEPAPFTIIRADDVKNGIWKAAHPSMQDYASKYVQALETNGRYPLMIWPYHCIIGEWGACIYPRLAESLAKWELRRRTNVNKLSKGSNFKTEHYSALQADVPVPSDPGTLLNIELIHTLESADRVIIFGEALSHCVKYTLTDITNHMAAEHIRKMVLLSDCMSPVPNTPGADFKAISDQFVLDMKNKGMTITTTSECLL